MTPGLHHSVRNPEGETFARSCIMVCRHCSPLACLLLTALSAKVSVLRAMPGDATLRRLTGRGLTVAVVGEDGDPCAAARRLRLDVLPVAVHGADDMMERNGHAVHSGTVTLLLAPRIAPDAATPGSMRLQMEQSLAAGHAALRRELETDEYLLPLVRARYIYKGVPMRRLAAPAPTEETAPGTVTVSPCGYGAHALLLALRHPEKTIIAADPSPDKLNILRHAAHGLVTNLVIRQGE